MLFNNNYVTSSFNVNEAVCTWKNHLESWMNFKNVSRLIIKYEDMVIDRKKILNQIIEFLNLFSQLKINNNFNQINNILKSTEFSKLQKLEKEKGFKEASNNSNFFRSGKSMQWKKILNNDQIKLIEKELYKPMKKLGYI